MGIKKELVGDGSSRTYVAIMFYLLNDHPFTKVGEPADPNRNRSSSKCASFPFTRFFLSSTWAGPLCLILSCRVNGPSNDWFRRCIQISKTFQARPSLFAHRKWLSAREFSGSLHDVGLRGILMPLSGTRLNQKKLSSNDQTYITDIFSSYRIPSRFCWRNTLRNSKITPDPRFEAGSGIRILKSRLVMDEYLQKSVGPAVLVSVAWALVLAKLFFGETEVVYGHVVAGKSTDLPGIESVVEPCINIIPVRVKLQTGWKIMEVFDSMASQLVSSGPFEGLDWNGLVETSTNWPPRGTQFGSVVHHRKIDFKPQIGLEGEQIQLDWFESHNRPAWTGITAHAEGSDLRIHFFANPESMDDRGRQYAPRKTH